MIPEYLTQSQISWDVDGGAKMAGEVPAACCVQLIALSVFAFSVIIPIWRRKTPLMSSTCKVHQKKNHIGLKSEPHHPAEFKPRSF